MRIGEIEKKDNQTIEQIIKRSLESYQLNIPGTAYFDPQLNSLAQFYKEQSNANYWVLVNERDEVVGGVGIAPFGQKSGVCELQKTIHNTRSSRRGFFEGTDESSTRLRQGILYTLLFRNFAETKSS